MKKKFLLILSFSMFMLNNKESVSYALEESSNDVEEDISKIEIPPEGVLYEYDMTPATNSLLGDYVLLSTSNVENKPNYVKHKYAGNGKYNYVGGTDGTIFISSSGYNSL